MNFIKKYKVAIVLIIATIFVSIIISNKYDFSSSKIIEYTYVGNAILTLFSVSLAIVALIITLLEKYKEKDGASKNWAVSSSDILKELSENTIFLLVLYIAVIACSVFDKLLTFEKIYVPELVLIFSLIMATIITFDTTISVYRLVVNLKNDIADNNIEDLKLSQKEKYVIEAYRFLNPENRVAFEKLISSLATNQQIENEKKK